MANSDKDILITPNKGTTSLPELSFIGQVNSPIKLRVLDDNTLSFEGSAGQLFSINNNLTTGTIFAVSDVSGVPSLSVNADGTVAAVPFNGNLAVGKTTATQKLDVKGSAAISGQLGIGGSAPSSSYGINLSGGINLSTGSISFGGYKTVSCYIRGTGSNNNTNPVVLVDGVNFMDSYGRGLMLIIINKSDLTKVSRNNYDTYGSSTDSDNLATALNAMTNAQIGILASYDAIESNITGNLRTAARRLGLYKLAAVDGTNGIRKPYAAIFTTSVSGANNSVEVLEGNASNSTYATIFTTIFTDGSAQGAGFSGGNTTNALIYGDPTQVNPAAIVTSVGTIGVNNTSPSSSYKIDVGGSVNVSTGNNYYINGVALLPVGTDSTRGANLVSDGSNGTFWAWPGANATSSPLSGFRYRSIITHGYLMGGYKGSQPWRSVNKTWHPTDVTYYCGEQLDRGASYLDGTWSDYNGYLHGTVDSFTGNSSHTSSINLHTGVRRQVGDGTYQPFNYGYTGNNPNADGMGYNTGGGWDMPAARDNNSCATAQTYQVGYNLGGGSAAVGKLHFPTEIMYQSGNSPSGSGHTASCGDQDQTWASFSGARYYMNHSNDSWGSWSSNAAPDGVCKFLPSKWGFFYAGTGSNVTTPWAKYNGASGASLATGNKVRSYGEENFEMGQDWGYLIGEYDGQQTNLTTKWNYANDTETVLGATAMPKGHYGQSSGGCASAAAAVTATRAL
jgi:hypothetical protein